MEKENKKRNGFLIFVIIMLLVIIGLLVIIILKNDNSLFSKNNNKKVTVKEEVKEDASDKEDNTYLYNEDLEKQIYEDKELGTIDFNDITYKVKIEYTGDSAGSNLYLNDKKLPIGVLNYIAVMDDDYLVINSNYPTSPGKYFRVYDKDFNEIESEAINHLTNDFIVYEENYDEKITTGSKKIKDYIDDNHLIISYCDTNTGKTNKYYQDFVEVLLTFDDGKIEKNEISRVESVFCDQMK